MAFQNFGCECKKEIKLKDNINNFDGMKKRVIFALIEPIINTIKLYLLVSISAKFDVWNFF